MALKGRAMPFDVSRSRVLAGTNLYIEKTYGIDRLSLHLSQYVAILSTALITRVASSDSNVMGRQTHVLTCKMFSYV